MKSKKRQLKIIVSGYFVFWLLYAILAVVFYGDTLINSSFDYNIGAVVVFIASWVIAKINDKIYNLED